jgi:hypothetical protein
MRDTSYQRVDEIKFFAFNIRNRGYMYMDNGIEKHILSGEYVRVYPGGLLNAKNLQINAATVIIDVMAEVRADHNGNCNGGI